METAYCCLERADVASWPMVVLCGIFLLVVATSVLLIRYSERRDSLVIERAVTFLTARQAFMDATWRYQNRPVRSVREAIGEMVQLGDASLKAFGFLRELDPVMEPDGDWTNTLLWVQYKHRLFMR